MVSFLYYWVVKGAETFIHYYFLYHAIIKIYGIDKENAINAIKSTKEGSLTSNSTTPFIYFQVRGLNGVIFILLRVCFVTYWHFDQDRYIG